MVSPGFLCLITGAGHLGVVVTAIRIRFAHGYWISASTSFWSFVEGVGAAFIGRYWKSVICWQGGCPRNRNPAEPRGPVGPCLPFTTNCLQCYRSDLVALLNRSRKLFQIGLNVLFGVAIGVCFDFLGRMLHLPGYPGDGWLICGLVALLMSFSREWGVLRGPNGRDR